MSPYVLHGAALLDYFRGETSAMLRCYQDGERDDVPAAFWFRVTLDPLETLALEQCRGSVLDVGAGAGVHSLELRRRGHAVTAIDIAAECVTIMHDRGIEEAIQADLYEFDGGPFDTILCLCNGLDKVGRLLELTRFLKRMRQLLAPGGYLIVDSFDLRVGADAARLAEIARKEAAGRYFGEMDMRFEYKGRSSAAFPVLQVDYETLSRGAEQNGWTCEMIASAGGHYVARAHANRI